MRGGGGGGGGESDEDEECHRGGCGGGGEEEEQEHIPCDRVKPGSVERRMVPGHALTHQGNSL